MKNNSYRNKKQLIIHLGYPKSGSTTLQKTILPHLQNTLYLGKFFFTPGKYLYKCSPSRLASQLRNKIEATSKSIIFISNEHLFSHDGLTGSMRSKKSLQKKGPRYDPFKTAYFIKEVLDFLYDIVDVKVLLFIRRQGDIIPSLYAQSARKHIHTKHISEGFDNFVNYIFSFSVQNYTLADYFNYNFIITHLENIFNPYNIEIIPMESLYSGKEDSHILRFSYLVNEYPSRIGNILAGINSYNVKSNKQDNFTIYHVTQPSVNQVPIHSRILIRSMRGLKYISSLNNNKNTLLEKKILSHYQLNKIKISNQIKEKLTNYYFNSNKILNNNYQLNLQELNYF